MLKDVENSAHLRDLNHTYGWKLYTDFAKSYIDQLTKDYLRENFNQEQAWEARVRLQAIMLFQARMEEIVRTAADRCDPAALERMVLENIYRVEIEDAFRQS